MAATVYSVKSIDTATGFPRTMDPFVASDGHLHVYNHGPNDVIAAFTEASSPTPPTPGDNNVVPIKAGEWTVVPSDDSGGFWRLSFTVVQSLVSSGYADWDGMTIWFQ